MQIWKKPYGQIKDWKFWVLGEGVEKSNMEEFCKKKFTPDLVLQFSGGAYEEFFFLIL